VLRVGRGRRPTASRTDANPVTAGDVEIRPDRFQAYVAGQSIDLTRREFELIELLASAEGGVLEREEIYSRLWGYTMVRGDRSVDVFVRKLRQKLERASPQWRYIHTHFGIGYRFAAESLEVVHPSDVPSSLPAGWGPDGAKGRLSDEGKLARPHEDEQLAAGPR
jgi:DNA-binding response OmpR family regulator